MRVRAMIKVETNVKVTGTTGYGSEDGGCLDAPSPKMRESVQEGTRTVTRFSYSERHFKVPRMDELTMERTILIC